MICRGCWRALEIARSALNSAKPCFVHVNHHPCDDHLPLQSDLKFFVSGSFLVGNTAFVQARTTLDKAASRLIKPVGVSWQSGGGLGVFGVNWGIARAFV